MKILRWIDNHLEAYIICTLLFTLTILVFIQVFMRYIMQNALSWSEELARYCMVWMIYIGVAYAAKHDLHIRVDAINLLLTDRMRKCVNIAAHLIFLAFSVTIAYLGYVAFVRFLGFGQRTPALRIPMAYVYAGVPLGFALTSIRLAQRLYAMFRDFNRPAEAPAALPAPPAGE